MKGKNYKKSLMELVSSINLQLRKLDKVVMKTESNYERGKQIALICNEMDMAIDKVLRFDFNMSFKRIAKIKSIHL